MRKSIIAGVLLTVIYLLLYYVELSPDRMEEYSVSHIMEGQWYVEVELPLEELMMKIEGEMNKGYFIGSVSSGIYSSQARITEESLGIEIEAYYSGEGIQLIKPEVISSTYSMEAMEEMFESLFSKEMESEKLDLNKDNLDLYDQVKDISFGYTDQPLSLKPRLEINNQVMLTEEITLSITLITISGVIANMDYSLLLQEENLGNFKLTNIQ